MTFSVESVICRLAGTSYKMIFIDFFVDFSDFARTAENPFIDPSKDQRNNAKRDKNYMKIAGFTVCAKKKFLILINRCDPI